MTRASKTVPGPWCDQLIWGPQFWTALCWNLADRDPLAFQRISTTRLWMGATVLLQILRVLLCYSGVPMLLCSNKERIYCAPPNIVGATVILRSVGATVLQQSTGILCSPKLRVILCSPEVRVPLSSPELRVATVLPGSTSGTDYCYSFLYSAAYMGWPKNLKGILLNTLVLHYTPLLCLFYCALQSFTCIIYIVQVDRCVYVTWPFIIVNVVLVSTLYKQLWKRLRPLNSGLSKIHLDKSKVQLGACIVFIGLSCTHNMQCILGISGAFLSSQIHSLWLVG